MLGSSFRFDPGLGYFKSPLLLSANFIAFSARILLMFPVEIGAGSVLAGRPRRKKGAGRWERVQGKACVDFSYRRQLRSSW